MHLLHRLLYQLIFHDVKVIKVVMVEVVLHSYDLVKQTVKKM
jgi:hypothetical protein